MPWPVIRPLWCLWLLLLGLSVPAWGQDVLPVPALSARVIDQTATLSPEQARSLDAKLAAIEGDLGSQIVVLMVATTGPEDLAEYAQRVGDNWKIGRRDIGDGLLIVVAKNDRKIRIEVAKTLEGAVPDLAARQIIKNDIGPAFKAGNYSLGLERGIEALQARIKSEGLKAPAPRSTSTPDGLGIEELGALFFIAVPVVGALLTAVFGRKLGSALTGGAAGAIGWFLTTSLLVAGAAGLASLVLVGVLGIGAARRHSGIGGIGGSSAGPTIWGAGSSSPWGGGGSSGGGGFSSGGGGDFGGGGASGDW